MHCVGHGGLAVDGYCNETAVGVHHWDGEDEYVVAMAHKNEILNPLGINFVVTFQKVQIVHTHCNMENTTPSSKKANQKYAPVVWNAG